ncbi:hypothetical protein RYZ20_02805 [Thioclava sp. A2]|uniref:hypothetical protein n=1 Tax=Thioclava sp. FCG-A2 TaxID=3080562 RepID=UPI002955CB88|nr:hypothetical protein [Thioclava sp. A2]MDV7269823.1 hypothetical protein [Thioclava sp. A2]
MSLIEDLAEKLAADTMAAMDEHGDDRLWVDVGNYIGTSSPSLQEAYNAACRIFLAERRGRKYLEDKIARLRDKPA